ncbi:HEPN domain-containing protein [candidate division TA06 bacterium]|uniref:HEPN domain-containing protein n=1 Tax=candidate division TA06 bacterium TaxID=2250710 RepID=A0A523XMV1_UNCT6|nr:MAG: HEPN domain-containing protein [candidate division TA06 bacterium]
MRLKECFDRGLLAKAKPSKNKTKQSLASTRSSLRKARDNTKINNMDVAVVMAYTSMFHAFRALLFADGVKERSHVCMLEYVKKGFPELKDLAKEADAYRRFRHTALYGLEVLVSREDAVAAIKLAEKISTSVVKVLRAR